MKIISNMENKIKDKNKKIVFVEGWDKRFLFATKKILEKKILQPILIGDAQKINNKIKELSLNLENINIIDPHTYGRYDEMVDLFLEIRKGKSNKEEAITLLKQPNYFGTMLVKLNEADGMIGGVEYSTADIIRPSLQIIKTKFSKKKVSSAFYMIKENEKEFIFGDCAINVEPNSEDLKDIAKYCYDFSKILDFKESKVAFLSFSTKGSFKGEIVEKVQKAAENFKNEYPDIISDGELQFDTAVVEEVATKKAKDSKIKGDANILIFPSLEAGNIGYKIAQRLGGYEALGPVVLGLNKPINDLSRGASAEDVYNMAILTASMCLDN